MKYGNTYRVIMFFLVCVLVVSINPLGAFAAEYFVATTGNDSNSGTIGSPFRTLEKAASVMSSGDTMFIRAGTYKRGAALLAVPSGGGSWATATTIKAYNNEKVIITPFDETTVWGSQIIQYSPGRSWIILDGVILDGLNQSGGKGGNNGFRGSDNGHHLRVINTEIRYVGSHGILTGSASDNEFINVHIHHANHLFDPGHPDYGRASYGIYQDNKNNLIQGCDIHHNRGYGIHNYSGAVYQPDNNTYIGNVVHENERTGFLVYTGKGNVLINNIAYGNGTGATSGYTGDARHGFFFNWGAHGTIMYNNTSYDNVQGELLIGGNANDHIVINNILYGKGSDPVVRIDSGTTGNIVTNNLIHHANSSLRIVNNGSAKISNNIVGENPFFVDEKNSAFHLQSGSPAIRNGIVLKEVKNDFDNVQRNLEEPFDMGAYVFVGSATLVDTIPPASPRNVKIQ